jgi:ubiquitin-protein ligase
LIFIKSIVKALPLEKNIYEWFYYLIIIRHGNMFTTEGKYKGIFFHFKLVFDEYYPISPPKVVMISHIVHKHVFKGLICLGILANII